MERSFHNFPKPQSAHLGPDLLGGTVTWPAIAHTVAVCTRQHKPASASLSGVINFLRWGGGWSCLLLWLALPESLKVKAELWWIWHSAPPSFWFSCVSFFALLLQHFIRNRFLALHPLPGHNRGTGKQLPANTEDRKPTAARHEH